MCYVDFMARPGRYLTIFFPEELLGQIEEFWHAERLPTRVQAIRILLERQLTERRLLGAGKKKGA